MSLKPKPQDSKPKPNKYDQNKVVLVPNEIENPFKSALIENQKIEIRQELEKQKLLEFNRKLKERIKAYKNAEQKMEEDALLIISKKIGSSSFKKQETSNLNKLKSKSAHELTNVNETCDNNLRPSTLTVCLDENLPNFVLRSIIDPNEVMRNNKQEYQKRISSTRKIYSNMERDKIKQDNISKIIRNKSSKQSNENLQVAKVVVEKNLKKKKDIRWKKI